MKRKTAITRDIIANNLRWENQGNETNRNYFLFLGGWNFHFGERIASAVARAWPRIIIRDRSVILRQSNFSLAIAKPFDSQRKIGSTECSSRRITPEKKRTRTSGDLPSDPHFPRQRRHGINQTSTRSFKTPSKCPKISKCHLKTRPKDVHQSWWNRPRFRLSVKLIVRRQSPLALQSRRFHSAPP